LTLVFGLAFFNCNQNRQKPANAEKHSDNLEVIEDSKDKEEIQNLIRQVLMWSDSNKSIDLLPVLTDLKDSIYVGFDLDKLKVNLDKLRETNFFSNEFIENYNKIILTLDRKLRDKEFDDWLVGDLPTFIFANDVNPWCLCQDNLSWDIVEIKIINLTRNFGELEWKWGNLGSDYDSSWKEFSYKFRVVNEDNKWKIDYLEGFDFKESTRKDGS
jgi:hypothetical protein